MVKNRKNLWLFICLMMLIAFLVVILIIFNKNDKNESNTKINSIKNENAESTSLDTKDDDLSEEELSSVDEYYLTNSVSINKVIAVNDSKDILTEKQVSKTLKDLGFNTYPITYEYDMDGNYIDENEVDDNSNSKHPMYQTYFYSEDGQLWTIMVINGDIIANPASYNLQSTKGAQTLISEKSQLTSYDSDNNMFLVTVPKESAVILEQVSKINSETLNEMTIEKIENYD